jgi:hypothetical protein
MLADTDSEHTLLQLLFCTVNPCEREVLAQQLGNAVLNYLVPMYTCTAGARNEIRTRVFNIYIVLIIRTS